MVERADNKILFFADGPLCPKLQGFLDGTLNAVEAESFRDHLCGCAACADALEDALQLHMLVDLSLTGRGEVDPLRSAEVPSFGQAASPLQVLR